MTYRRDLSTTRVGSTIIIIHNGKDFAETTAPPLTVLQAIDEEVGRVNDRLEELKSARNAIVRSSRKLLN